MKKNHRDVPCSEEHKDLRRHRAETLPQAVLGWVSQGRLLFSGPQVLDLQFDQVVSVKLFASLS